MTLRVKCLKHHITLYNISQGVVNKKLVNNHLKVLINNLLEYLCTLTEVVCLSHCCLMFMSQ